MQNGGGAFLNLPASSRYLPDSGISNRNTQTKALTGTQHRREDLELISTKNCALKCLSVLGMHHPDAPSREGLFLDTRSVVSMWPPDAGPFRSCLSTAARLQCLSCTSVKRLGKFSRHQDNSEGSGASYQAGCNFLT